MNSCDLFFWTVAVFGALGGRAIGSLLGRRTGGVRHVVAWFGALVGFTVAFKLIIFAAQSRWHDWDNLWGGILGECLLYGAVVALVVEVIVTLVKLSIRSIRSPTSEDVTDSTDRPRPMRFSLQLLLVAVLLASFVIALGMSIRAARNAAIDICAQGPLNQLQLALSNYHYAYGCFPPAYIADKDGKPMHSWRVLLLPFIGEEAYYKSYDFNEPWNGPHNSKLANKMPKIFHIPSEPPSTSLTNVVAITGPGTAFPGSRSTREEEFTDGLNNTILLTEIADSDINWLEPRDLNVNEMSFVVNDRSKPSISASRRKGPYVVFADRIRAHRISPSLSPTVLKALTTVAGGERIYIVGLRGVVLTSPTPGPVMDKTVKRLDLDGVYALWLNHLDVTDDALERLATEPCLTELYLRGTRITDEGLRHFQQGAALRTSDFMLDLSYTAISDNGLHHLAGLTGQHHLHVYLEGTRVTMLGIAQFLQSLPNLGFPGFRPETWIHLKEGSVSQHAMLFNDSALTDAEIACFQGLHTLRQADLSKTQITDAGLANLKGMPLKWLSLNGTQISDAGLAHLKDLPNLDNLDLERTQITGVGLAYLKDLQKLETLDLKQTKITDAGLVHLGQFAALRWLDLSNTNITDGAIPYLQQLKNLTAAIRK